MSPFANILLTLVTVICQDKVIATTITTAKHLTNESNYSIAAHVIITASTTTNTTTENWTNKSHTNSTIPATVEDNNEDSAGRIRKETKTISTTTTTTPMAAEESTNKSNDSATTPTLRKIPNETKNNSNSNMDASTLIPATVVPILIIGLMLLALVIKFIIINSFLLLLSSNWVWSKKVFWWNRQLKRVQEEVDDNPNYDAIDYEGSHQHHHHHHHRHHDHNRQLLFFAENFDDNGSNREDSNQSREMTTREVKAEVLWLQFGIMNTMMTVMTVMPMMRIMKGRSEQRCYDYNLELWTQWWPLWQWWQWWQWWKGGQSRGAIMTINWELGFWVRWQWCWYWCQHQP